MTNPAAVTVLMAVYDPEPNYLREAIRSVLDQTFREFELLIVEDAGPRSADAVLREFSDPRIRHLRTERREGLGASLNRGLHNAQTELIARLDADDVCRADRLERQVAFMRDHPEVAVYGSRIRIIDDRGKPIARRLLPLQHDEIAAAFQRYNCISHPAAMFRRDAVLALGGYSEDIRAEDYDLWCRMLLAGQRFENADEDLVSYRFHPTALKGLDVHGQIRTTMAIKKRYFAKSMGPRAKMRLAGERLLLLLPPSLIVALFRRLEYRS